MRAPDRGSGVIGSRASGGEMMAAPPPLPFSAGEIGEDYILGDIEINFRFGLWGSKDFLGMF